MSPFSKYLILFVFNIAALPSLAAEKLPPASDWPQWRGPNGDGTWVGAPQLKESWPNDGLPVVWRAEIGGGYAGVTVADGRVYLFDRKVERGPGDAANGKPLGPIVSERERLLCLDAGTGRELWQFSYPETYGDLDYGNGPRAAPTIAGKSVLTIGALGKLHCLRIADGSVEWSVDLVKDYQGRPPTWGYAASPLVRGDSVIVIGGGKDDRSVLALEKSSGKLQWSSLSDKAGYTWPVAVEREGHTQLVCWTPSHVRGIDARDGKPLWEYPYEITYGVSIATPIVHDGIVLVCGYWHGSRAIQLGAQPTDARLKWEENRYLRGLMSQPLYRDGYVYLLDKQYGLTCFELATGKKVWDDENTLTPRGRNPQASLVWLGDEDRIIALNAEGELVLAHINPDGYSEIARAKIIDHTWAHPAYSGNRVFARSDSELVCVELPVRE
ncbi:MAG: PQQ-binding-like beta-propeller repeat protein [Planctomycetota bacterium]|jgi:outer membrane protein assembly factor BamB